MCVSCTAYAAYDYNKLISVYITEFEAALQAAIQAKADAEALLVTYKSNWDALQAEYDGLVPEVDPLLEEFDSLVTEAQLVAEEALKCPYGITEYQQRLINAEVLRDEWAVKLQTTWLSQVEANVSGLASAVSSAEDNYDDIFNDFYDASYSWYSEESWDNTRRMLNDGTDPAFSDFSIVFSLASTDRTSGVTLCVDDDDKLSGIQMHYGTWDDFSSSYIGATKDGVTHGSLDGDCTTTGFAGDWPYTVTVWSDDDDDNRVHGVRIAAYGDDFVAEAGSTSGRERSIENSEFFGFETDLDPVTGNIWNIEPSTIDWSDFSSQKATLDNAPATLFQTTKDLNAAYLDVYEANQWIYVSKILESNTLAHLAPAEPADVYVLRADEKEEKEALIAEIQENGGSGDAFPDHLDKTRIDNTGAWVGLIVGLVMLLSMIAGMIIRMTCAKRMQAASGDRRMLVNQSSNRSLNQSNSMHSPGRRNPDDI